MKRAGFNWVYTRLMELDEYVRTEETKIAGIRALDAEDALRILSYKNTGA